MSLHLKGTRRKWLIFAFKIIHFSPFIIREIFWISTHSFPHKIYDKFVLVLLILFNQESWQCELRVFQIWYNQNEGPFGTDKNHCTTNFNVHRFWSNYRSMWSLAFVRRQMLQWTLSQGGLTQKRTFVVWYYQRVHLLVFDAQQVQNNAFKHLWLC